METTAERRTVWITGAGSGIGAALAREFAGAGDTVFVSGRRPERLEQLRAAAGGAIRPVVCDVRHRDEVEAAAAAILREVPSLDVLVNNAGVTVFRSFANTAVEDFEAIIDTNLKALFYTTRAVLPGMLAAGRGTIINIVSSIVKGVYPYASAYAASKAGAEAMMNVLRAEVREKGIKVVNVHPGPVETEIWNERQREKHGAVMARAEEIARAVHRLSLLPQGLMAEEIVLKPQQGDLK